MITKIEEVAAYWDRSPCNIRHSNKKIGTKEYFDEVEKRKYFVEPHIPEFANFKMWNGKKVLEIGCGIGTDAVNFARHGADYTGIDLSRKSLEIARQRFDLFGFNGRFVHANAERVSEYFLNEKFDLIYALGVLHHTPFPERAVEEIGRVVKPDGEFRLLLYAKNSWKDIMIEAGFDQPEARSKCPIAFRYTTEQVHSLLRGFRVGAIEQDHIFPYVVEDYKKYRYRILPWFERMPPQMFRALEKRLGWHLLVTAYPD